MAPVDAAETVGQIAAKPGADDPRDANGDAEHQSGLSRAEAVRALEQDQRPKILAIGEEGNKRSADGEVEERARSEHFASRAHHGEVSTRRRRCSRLLPYIVDYERQDDSHQAAR